MTEFAYGEGSGEEGPSVPGFRVVRRIGTGGFSTVYEAVQEDVDAPVAIKILNVDAADSRTRTRLERECRSMGRLRDQPGIVAVYRAAFTTDGRPAVVMAHLPGGSLADRLDHGPLPPHEVATIGTTIARALDAAHRQGIYHRDIKPENILLDRDGQPHLADFGLALIDDLTNSTQTDSTLTPPHAPPERFITAPAGDDPARGDIYSLCSTLYHLLAGHPPFGSAAEGGLAALIDRILTQPPPPITRPDIPTHLTAAIIRGLAKDPTDRQPDARTLATQLTEPGTGPRTRLKSPSAQATAHTADRRDLGIVPAKALPPLGNSTRASNPLVVSVSGSTPGFGATSAPDHQEGPETASRTRTRHVARRTSAPEPEYTPKPPTTRWKWFAGSAAVAVVMAVGVGGLLWTGTDGPRPSTPPATRALPPSDTTPRGELDVPAPTVADVEPVAGGHAVSFTYSLDDDYAAAYRMRKDDVVGELVPLEVNTTIQGDRATVSHWVDDTGAEEAVDATAHTYCVQMILAGIPKDAGDPPTVESEWACSPEPPSP